MLAPTHSAFGIFLTLIILSVFGVQESLHWTILLMAVIGSIMPDLDHPKSAVGRVFSFISVPLDRRFGHRTITHSLFGWGVASGIAALLIGSGWAIDHTFLQTHFPLLSVSPHLAIRWLAAFSIGYISHVLLDMVNPRGVQLFWPDETRDLISRSPAFRPESGSKAEILICAALVCLMFLSFPISKYGIMTSLRWLLATPESAIAEFKTASTKTYVEFDGIFAQTRIPIHGTAEVLDAKNKRLIVVLNGHVYSISDEVSADIISKSVRVQKTKEPVSITRRTFEDKTKDELLAAVPDNAFISGTVQLPKDLVLHYLPNSITQTGQQLNLTFATKSQLENLKIDDAFDLLQKQDALKFAEITQHMKHIKGQLASLEDTKGLTPLGSELLSTQKEKDDKAQKIEDLNQELEILKLNLDEITLTRKTHRLVFSGEVTIRKS